MHWHASQYSNRGYRERKHETAKKTKNSYIGYLCACIKTDVFEDKKARILQNLQSLAKKDYKLYTNTSKIICNLVSNQQLQENTCKCINKGFGVFEECTNRSKCKESSYIDQLSALQVETQEVGNCKQ